MLKNYLKMAWRNIRRNRVYTFINILGLSIGLIACLVIFLITRFELGTDTFHPDGDRIYRLIGKKQQQGGTHLYAMVPPIAPLAARTTIPGLEAVAAYHRYTAQVLAPGAHDPVPATTTIIAEPQYFLIFHYDWLAGNPLTSLRTPFKVVLTQSRARIYFGNISPDKLIGRTLVYNDSLRLTVSGIVKDWTENTDFPYTDFISFSTINVTFLRHNIHLDEWGTTDIPWYSRAFVRLAKGTTPSRVNTLLATLSDGHIHPEDGVKYSLALQPLADIHFDTAVEDGLTKAHRPTLYALIAVAIFILLLAIVNFINLSTAMAMRRAKEVGVRKILGSRRPGLIGQFLIETGLLTGCAMVIALLALNPIMTLFHAFLPNRLEFHLLSPAVLLFLVLMTFLTTLLSGLYPAKVLSAWLPVLCLKGTGPLNPNEKGRLRKSLIVFQFATSLVFIISTIVIGRQINYMRTEDLGFSSDAILTIATPHGDTTKRIQVMAKRFRQLAGVSDAAAQSFPPTTYAHATAPLQFKGKYQVDISAALQIADEHFIPLYRIRLLAGINLRPRDSAKEVVVNESMTRAMGLTDPREAVGKNLFLGESPLPIIGVIADFHEYSYHEAIMPIIMMDFPAPLEAIAVKLGTQGQSLSQFKTTLGRMAQAWKLVYPETPFNYTFLDDSIASMYEKERKTATLMNTAMVITIFISCMGLLGLVMFTAGRRKKEIGIRKVLGASVIDIALMLSGSFARLILIAVLIASPVAWYLMNNWLQNFAYRIPIGGTVFFLAGGIALSIAMLTIGFQTLKLAFTNPAEILRSE